MGAWVAQNSSVPSIVSQVLLGQFIILALLRRSGGAVARHKPRRNLPFPLRLENMQLYGQLLALIGHGPGGLLQLFDVFRCLAQYGCLPRLNVSIYEDGSSNESG